MIIYSQARDALVTRVNTVLGAAFPTMPVFYENTVKVDTNTVGDQFMQVEVSFEDSFAVTLDSDPVDKVSGFVGFRLLLKEGKGTRSPLVVFDTLNAQLRHQTLSGVTTFSPVFGRKGAKDGWAFFEIGFPFSYYSSN